MKTFWEDEFVSLRVVYPKPLPPPPPPSSSSSFFPVLGLLSSITGVTKENYSILLEVSKILFFSWLIF
jgi:hypothetical protein